MLTLFSQTDVEYSPSRIPCSWRVLHILMCFTGVSNVFFMPSLPRCLRMTSLVYHDVWLCISAKSWTEIHGRQLWDQQTLLVLNPFLRDTETFMHILQSLKHWDGAVTGNTSLWWKKNACSLCIINTIHIQPGYGRNQSVYQPIKDSVTV